MRYALATGAAALAVALALACSGGGGGTGGGGGGAPATDVTTFGQDFCGLLEPCCADAGLGTSGVLCTAFVQEAASKGTYDPTAGQACISALQAQSAADLCASLGNDVPACSQVFSKTAGTVQPGQPCSQDSDCAKASGGSATCYEQTTFVDGGTTQTKTCVQTTAGKAGDAPCIGTVEAQFTVFSWSGQGPPPGQAYLCSNADGLTCNDQTQKCTALGDVGASCSGNSDCVATAYCAFGAGSSTCQARLADGASCASAQEGCQSTSYCASSTQTCTPFTPPGQPCSVDQQCQNGCTNGTCNKASSGDFGLALLCGG